MVYFFKRMELNQSSRDLFLAAHTHGARWGRLSEHFELWGCELSLIAGQRIASIWVSCLADVQH